MQPSAKGSLDKCLQLPLFLYCLDWDMCPNVFKEVGTVNLNELLDRALQNIEAFLLHEPRSTRSLQGVELTPPLARALENALLQRRWVGDEALDSKSSRPSLSVASGLLPFVSVRRMRREIVKQFSPLLQELSVVSGQTVILSVLDDSRGFCLHRFHSPNAIKLISRIGEEIPLHAGASGKILLSFGGERLIQKNLQGPLKIFTPYTPTRETLMDDIARIQLQGFCYSREEVDPGACALAFPVLSRQGHVVFGISLAGSRFAFEEDYEVFFELLERATDKIRQQLQ